MSELLRLVVEVEDLIEMRPDSFFLGRCHFFLQELCWDISDGNDEPSVLTSIFRRLFCMEIFYAIFGNSFIRFLGGTIIH